MTEIHTYSVSGMDCAGCAETLQNGIGKLDGVNAVRVDFMAGKLHVEGNLPLNVLQDRAQALGGYKLSATAPLPNPLPGGVRGFVLYLLRERPTQLALIGGLIVVLTLILSSIGLPPVIANALYVGALVVAAYPIAPSGITNLVVNRTFNINMLMTIAAVGAVIIGENLEAAVVIFLFAIGEALEGFTADRARESIRALSDLVPATATRITGAVVPVEALQVDDAILVKPGERIPMDGVVVAGESSVNQAPITGESIPVAKFEGANVYAGTINGDGALTVKVTHLAADNTLQRIIQLVEEAQNVRAPSQRQIDRFAKYYTPAVVSLALLVATIPPLFFGQPFWEPVAGGHGWLHRALVLLIIACPCALVISTPVAVVSAITNAARRGVLIKGGLHLEMLGTAKAIAFDKTGTLTRGEPQVTNYHAINCEPGCVTCDEMLAVAASVEQQSTHPLAAAVVRAADRLYPAQGVTNLAGRGIEGLVNGQRVTVGSHRLFDEQFPHEPALCAEVEEFEQHGQTTMLVAQDGSVTGVIAVADMAREESKAVVKSLNDLGVQTVMLTGDNTTVAHVIGAQVGVGDVRANLLPEDKSSAVTDLLDLHGSVAMVGDGVNDTPALARATVGIAMGGAGSAQAVETADIVLMGDDLQQLPFAVRLSRFATRIIRENIALSVGVKLGFVALAVAGFASLWLAIIADVGMLLLVTLNGMRPIRFESHD